ncbi:hypothetical protein BASA50_009354 [Batrachochytrium salamandrivorans]|uniref:Aromatic amino acid beta-eliminating lyase/threonine aldolase domain-containing protein n=1 Tax=Batrachochytrium salamandrivorans TaxID=1357716 RepID=A0ABQ8F1G2_9FUNG|nr:hypothetical protein BASA60_008481 [Batrachochytrium salamandrivorans]KAH6570740.1 hypothetical protein BASA62_004155 [Batrachochytrium salamandrivorans]KAH6586615.1 hypothetical protein BASA61_006531 [Batrachochytrium salamandrivorans]KAH6590379.1 hypothetical protein BASA50_009354 [Batrachochytrium salamandrivorans]KAH9255020.1 hypothetical protein BASA81_006965 [Batrachochytrium salamandrivorans]
MADLRSDTFTKPTQGMMEAMMSSPVGDDVYEEDPTVNLLQDTVARLAGKEAALFCSSGTLSNQLAIRTHLVQPPYSMLCDARAHIITYEASGVSFHCGAAVTPVTPTNGSGHLTADQVAKRLILSKDVHYAPTALICLENTLDGSVFPLKDMEDISALAKTHSIPMHMDGARLWNASVATGISIREYCKPFDSVSLCFSKGLGAPIGSVLVGTTKYIQKARHFRKLYGGGWRQAGILAGACLYALEHHWPSMKEVHANATYLTSKLSSMGFGIAKPTETNMVWLDAKPLGMTSADVAHVLAKHEIKVSGSSDPVTRMVLHHQVSREHIEQIVDLLSSHISSIKTK